MSSQSPSSDINIIDSEVVDHGPHPEQTIETLLLEAGIPAEDVAGKLLIHLECCLVAVGQ